MSISASLANALSGLNAASRAAELVSSNVANSMTEGYARRELQISSRLAAGLGAGVQVDGVQRVVDEVLLRDRRLSEAELARSETVNDFYRKLYELVGEPGTPRALSDVQSAFEASLIEAASSPESDAQLASVLNAAKQLSAKLNEIGDGIQALREDADQAIAREVARLNGTLVQIAELNEAILSARSTGVGTASLLDQRQELVDDVSSLVPLRQFERENGTIALYSLGGTLLLDVKAASFEFESRSPILADMTLQSGALSGLSVNGKPISLDDELSPISGGRLIGLFGVRDSLAVQSQTKVDEVARDLVSRFESPGPDPTLAPGDPGLFTDRGSALDLSILDGLASRISINSSVDPRTGGELWRLRSGIAATAPGPLGDNSLLADYAAALEIYAAPNGGTLGTASRSASGFAGALLSDIGQSFSNSSNIASYTTARLETFREAESYSGVDTDQEMQKLLLVEQAYAANARVIQTVDELIQTLIGL